MRLRTTHTATIYGDRVKGENSIGAEQTVPDEPLVELRGRFRPQGEGWTRESRSPRVDQSPTVVVAPRGRDPDTGAQIAVDDVATPGQRVEVSGESTTFQLTRVVPHFGRGGNPHRYTLELESTSDE